MLLSKTGIQYKALHKCIHNVDSYIDKAEFYYKLYKTTKFIKSKTLV